MINACDENIIYSLNIDDIQDVAEQVIDRQLTNRELSLVQKTIGDYIDWFQAIELAIQEHIKE